MSKHALVPEGESVSGVDTSRSFECECEGGGVQNTYHTHETYLQTVTTYATHIQTTHIQINVFLSTGQEREKRLPTICPGPRHFYPVENVGHAGQQCRRLNHVERR